MGPRWTTRRRARCSAGITCRLCSAGGGASPSTIVLILRRFYRREQLAAAANGPGADAYRERLEGAVLPHAPPRMRRRARTAR